MLKENYRASGFVCGGVLSKEELASLPTMPSRKRMEKGPVAIVECPQPIPCNPCESSCKEGALTIGEDITAPPRLDEDRCTGCGLCIPACPGLAIFVVDLSYAEDRAVVRLPYEFLPLPQKGQAVEGLNRKGQMVTKGRIIKVVNPKKNDRTPVVWVAVPKKVAMDVRAIRISGTTISDAMLEQ